MEGSSPAGSKAGLRLRTGEGGQLAPWGTDAEVRTWAGRWDRRVPLMVFGTVATFTALPAETMPVDHGDYGIGDGGPGWRGVIAVPGANVTYVLAARAQGQVFRFACADDG